MPAPKEAPPAPQRVRSRRRMLATFNEKVARKAASRGDYETAYRHRRVALAGDPNAVRNYFAMRERMAAMARRLIDVSPKQRPTSATVTGARRRDDRGRFITSGSRRRRPTCKRAAIDSAGDEPPPPGEGPPPSEGAAA